MSESSSSPSQGQQSGQASQQQQQQDYFNYFSGSSSELPSYYPGRYDSYVNPYQLYGSGSTGAGVSPASPGSAAAAAAYYPNPTSSSSAGPPTSFSTSPNEASFGPNYSSYYVAAAAAAAASQYYPPPPPAGTYGNYGGATTPGSNQTIYHLSDHLPPPSTPVSNNATGSSSISNSSSSSLMDSSPDFGLDSGKSASGRKSSLSRGRGKPRRNSDSPIIPNNNINRVFIWDLDETIIIYHTLLTGSYAERYSKDINHLSQLAQSMENIIFSVADNNFFYNDLEDCDQVHIDDVAGDDNGQDLNTYNFSNDGFRSSVSTNETYMASGSGIRGGVEWMRKLSFRFRKIKESYNLYRNNIGELLGSPKQENWSSIIEELEIQTNGWYGIALKCLKLISERTNCVNVLVTKTQLVDTITKVLLFRLGPIFQVENLYSAAKIGMNACFDRITQRFGKKNITYVVIGDGEDEEMAAKNLTYPYWRVSELKDLDALYNALKLDYI